MPQTGKKEEILEDKTILKEVGDPPRMEKLMRKILQNIIDEKKQKI